MTGHWSNPDYERWNLGANGMDVIPPELKETVDFDDQPQPGLAGAIITTGTIVAGLVALAAVGIMGLAFWAGFNTGD